MLTIDGAISACKFSWYEEPFPHSDRALVGARVRASTKKHGVVGKSEGGGRWGGNACPQTPRFVSILKTPIRIVGFAGKRSHPIFPHPRSSPPPRASSSMLLLSLQLVRGQNAEKALRTKKTCKRKLRHL